MHAFTAFALVLRAACAAVILCGTATAAELPVLNPGFEHIDTSGKLLNWTSQLGPGTSLQDCGVKRQGRCSLRLSSAMLGGRPFVSVSQAVPAAGIDGRSVRLSGWIKVSGHTSGPVALWLRAESESGMERLDNMAGREPKGTTDWQRFELEVPLTVNSRTIRFGALLGGDGEAWFDDLNIEVPPPAPKAAVQASLPSPYSVAGTRPLSWSPQYDDLAFLKPLLQEKRIVALGESGHGVAQFNAIKVRMIKYLHEQLGYNLIAFEAPMAGCAAADAMIGSEPPHKVMRKCLFGVWHSSETVELFNYVAKARAAGRDLHITGFDVQDMRLQPGGMDLIKRIIGPQRSELTARFERAETALATIRAKRPSAAEEAELTDVYRTVAEALGDHDQPGNGVDAGERTFLRMQMLSRVAVVAMSVAPMGSREALEGRDAAMAVNFNYLLQQRHPGKKVIVWGHNAHVAKQWPEPQQPRMMGSHLAETYGKSMYVVGLVMGSGQAANNMRQLYDVAQPDPASIEGAFAGAAVKMGFLDFASNKASWMSMPVMTRDWGKRPIFITPEASFDGLIYIDTVTPPAYM